ncbi:MAG: hypothetical protein EZS28_047997, partial [Streblomastix strix]
TEQNCDSPLIVFVSYYLLDDPVEIHANQSTTVSELKKRALPFKNENLCQLFLQEKRLKDSESAFAQGVRSGDKLLLVDKEFIKNQITQLENDYYSHEKEMVKQVVQSLQQNEDDIFRMDKGVNKDFPLELVESEKDLIIDFNSNEYSSADTPQQKIELAYKKLNESKNSILKKHSLNSSDPEMLTEEQMNEKYFLKWKKQVQFYYIKDREIYFYLNDHKQEILSPNFKLSERVDEINAKFPYFINLSETISGFIQYPFNYDTYCQQAILQLDNKEQERYQAIEDTEHMITKGYLTLNEIGFGDLKAEFDDEYNEDGEYLGLKKQEITKEEFESIAQNYAVQYKIQNQHELQNHSKVVLQG